MLYQKFINIVEEHAEKLTENWIEEVKNNPSTTGYRQLDDETLGERIFDIYKRLGEWIMQNDPLCKKNAEHFIKLGRERAVEGIKASESIYALILARVVLWKYISQQGIINNSIELHQALEFYCRVTNFFDKAIYFLAAGYEAGSKTPHEIFKTEGHIEKSIHSITSWFIKKT